MKKKFLALILMTICALMLAMPAQAATVSTQYLNTLTGDEFYDKSIPSSGNYGRVAKAPAAAALTVVDDGTGNYVYQMAGNPTTRQAMIVYTYANLDGTSSKIDESFWTKKLQKLTARVKLPSESGETHLFSVTNAWAISVNSDTAGVLLKNGGAYYYDTADKVYKNFIADNTMSTSAWYTIEAVYDRQGTGISMYATVYDSAGTAVGSSGWVHVSSFTNNGFLRTQISTTGYAEGENVFIDDVSLYHLATTTVTCDSQNIAADFSSASFTFSEALDVATLTKDNVILSAENPTLDVSEKYDITYADGTLTLSFDELPYNEKYTITLTKNVSAAGDIFGLPQEIKIPFATPEDPLKESLDSVVFAAADGSVTASLTLANTSSRDREYMFVITSWNADNECVDIKNYYGNIEAGDSENLTLPAVAFEDSGSVIRLSLLDNWYSIIPVGDAVTYQLP